MTKKMTIEEELKELASCSHCRIALKKSDGFKFVRMHKMATWDYPSYQPKGIELPWKEAVGVLCNTCASQNKKPYFAVELRGDSVFNYTPVELKDVFDPSEELLQFLSRNKIPFQLSVAPRQVKEAVEKFIRKDELTDEELSVVKWYIWQWFKGKEVPEDFNSRIINSEEEEIRRLLRELPSDPFH
ncbi:MAG: hypothetical protein QXG05_00155 [Nitrososphaerota archaeon]